MNTRHIILVIVAIMLGGLRAEVVPGNMAEYFAPRENVLGLPDFKSNLPNVRFARVEDRRKAYRMISLRIPNDITEEWADAKARELKEHNKKRSRELMELRPLALSLLAADTPVAE